MLIHAVSRVLSSNNNKAIDEEGYNYGLIMQPIWRYAIMCLVKEGSITQGRQHKSLLLDECTF